MDINPRLIRAQARRDGTLHRCWYCARPIAYQSWCRTWSVKTSRTWTAASPWSAPDAGARRRLTLDARPGVK